MSHTGRAAAGAWEALFRAQVTVGRELSSGEASRDLHAAEYGVLYALTKDAHGVRITDLTNDVLLTQPGVSRLADRMERKGLIERIADPEDARATRLVLTTAGWETQRRIGRIHAREILAAMSRNLSADELEQLRTLCEKLIAPQDQSRTDAAPHPDSAS